MANWYSQTITFHGIATRINEVLEYISNDEILFSFNSIIPIPESVSEDELMEWKTENWGSTWDHGVDEFRTGNSIGFTTALSLPFPLYKALSRKFTDVGLEISYFIESDGDSGTIKIIEGTVFYEEYICCGYVDYYSDIQEFADFVKDLHKHG
jgi:hypothetical protein